MLAAPKYCVVHDEFQLRPNNNIILRLLLLLVCFLISSYVELRDQPLDLCMFWWNLSPGSQESPLSVALLLVLTLIKMHRSVTPEALRRYFTKRLIS